MHLKSLKKAIVILSIILNSSIISSENDFYNQAVEKLQKIHSKLNMVHGSLNDEYPEQLMTSMFLPSDAKVLEIGGNVGRNSCVIASILNDSKNLVVVESSLDSAKHLIENRDKNKFKFHVEAAAISALPLLQKGWVTIPSDIDLPGYTRVKTIKYEDLKKKYSLEFDTLVADCEGALYYILQDAPDLLKNIKLIIVENDYPNQFQRDFVANLYLDNGFELVYSADYFARIGFYEVWKKPI